MKVATVRYSSPLLAELLFLPDSVHIDAVTLSSRDVVEVRIVGDVLPDVPPGEAIPLMDLVITKRAPFSVTLLAPDGTALHYDRWNQ